MPYAEPLADSSDDPALVESRSRSLTFAGVLTLAVGLTILAVAVVTLAQGHGVFSAGAGTMLVLYGLVVCLLGFFAVRGVSATSGMVIAAAVLHVMVVVSFATNGAPWMWWATVPLIATAVAGVRARVALHRARAGSRD